MINQNTINTALNAADAPIMVESANQLSEAADEWLECDVIGIDTEFVRERTWRAELGLIQLSDGNKVWLVDPLKTGQLDPLAAVLGKRDILKTLHAPPEDLDVLLFTTGAVPEPLFDTQTACAMLGRPLQMGYHTAVEWLLGVTIDKGQTRSNWCQRPLRPEQLKYAALDVCLLPIMQQELQEKLEGLGRESWLEEDCARLLTRARTPADPDHSWKRLNGNGRFDGPSLAILQALAKWRDQEAEKRNLARGFVIKDNDLLTIANKQPVSLSQLSELNIIHPKALQLHGNTLVGIVDQVLGKGLSAVAPATLGPGHRKLMSDMRKLVQLKASELLVDPALLASRRELESLILLPADEPLPERFLGWRNDIITTGLVALKEAFA